MPEPLKFRTRYDTPAFMLAVAGVTLAAICLLAVLPLEPIYQGYLAPIAVWWACLGILAIGVCAVRWRRVTLSEEGLERRGLLVRRAVRWREVTEVSLPFWGVFGAPAIVLGKYLGILALLLSLVVLVGLLPLSLAAGATLDYGKLLAGLLGLSLLAASAAAAGLYISTLTTQPVVAATVTLGLLLALEVVDAAGHLFRYLSLLRHYDALLLGLVNSADIAYYLLFATAFLGLAIRRLGDMRLRD